MIYVLRTKGAPFIKIGFTDNSISRRINNIQTCCPYVIELIHVEAGDLKDEKQLHRSLKKYRAYGEWFQLREETLKPFRLTNDSPALNPDDIATIPSVRQFRLNNRFSGYRNPNIEGIISLEDFCTKYDCSEEEIIRIDDSYAKFIIVDTNPLEIKNKYGYTTGHSDTETKRLFIIPKFYL